MKYTIYNTDTGQIQNVISTTDQDLIALNLAGRNYIEGDYSGREYYIDNGQCVAKPQDPSTNVIKYNFDYATKSWVVNQELTEFATRKYRNILLTIVDRINPVWYASLTQEQQAELVAYRQQLLDVPQQEGFPITVSWPAQPTWL